MAVVRRFEDLVAWQKARVLTREIYLLTRESPFDRDFGLRDQIRRAAVSIMANVAEGFERKNPRDFANFLLIAKASCAEVGSHLYVALDAGYLNQDQFDELSAQVNEIGRVIGGLRATVRRALLDAKPPADASTRNSELGTRN